MGHTGESNWGPRTRQVSGEARCQDLALRGTGALLKIKSYSVRQLGIYEQWKVYILLLF